MRHRATERAEIFLIFLQAEYVMGAKVWLVDDDVSVRESLGFLLRTVDYEVADFADLASFETAAAVSKPYAAVCCLTCDSQRVAA